MVPSPGELRPRRAAKAPSCAPARLHITSIPSKADPAQRRSPVQARRVGPGRWLFRCCQNNLEGIGEQSPTPKKPMAVKAELQNEEAQRARESTGATAPAGNLLRPLERGFGMTAVTRFGGCLSSLRGCCTSRRRGVLWISALGVREDVPTSSQREAIAIRGKAMPKRMQLSATAGEVTDGRLRRGESGMNRARLCHIDEARRKWSLWPRPARLCRGGVECPIDAPPAVPDARSTAGAISQRHVENRVRPGMGL